jgi:glutathionyl-hydroquinone reductase
LDGSLLKPYLNTLKTNKMFIKQMRELEKQADARSTSKVNKYPDGYQPKIDYWMEQYYIALGKGVCAYNDGDVEMGKVFNEDAHNCMSKVSYFQHKERTRTSKGLFTLNENR